MGTKVQKFSGYYSMRDLNEESSSCGWPLLYGENKALTNGQYYNNYLPSSTTADACSVYDKDFVKQMMLEHEATFKSQVYELHRLYRIQRDLMNEAKRKELHKNHIPVEASYSTCPLASQITTEDGQKSHISDFLVGSSTCAKTSASAIEGIHTPLGSIKGIGKESKPFPSPNGSSSKDVELLESRPSKVRRRMFDLQLPANEYIDTDESEKLNDEKFSGPAMFFPDRNGNTGKEGVKKLFCGNGGKTVTLGETSNSEQCSGRNGLADLNEPVQVEETNDSPYVELRNHDPCQVATECSEHSATKKKTEFFGSSRDHFLNSHQGTDSWVQSNGYLENNGNGKSWIPSVADTGRVKSNLQSIPQVLKLEKSHLSSQTMQDGHSKAHESTSDYLIGQSKADLWRERNVNALDIDERNHEHTVNRHPSLFAVSPSSDLSKSWSNLASSWEMANGNLNQKLISVQKPPFLKALDALSRSSQSHQSNGVLEASWPQNINSKPDPGFHCDVPVQNGFYPGLSSYCSKEPSTNISSISYDRLNHDNDCKIIPQHFINNLSSKSCKGSNSNCNDVKAGKGIDLNVLLSNGSSMDGEKEHEDHVVLPWLRAKTMCKNEVENADRCITIGESSFSHVASKSNKGKTGQGASGTFLHIVPSVSGSNEIEQSRMKLSEFSGNKKILGVPIFDIPHVSPKKEVSSNTPPSMPIRNPCDLEPAENSRKTRIFDINLPCDDAAALELDEVVNETIVTKERSSTSKPNSRIQIDLNLSMSDDEASLMSIPSANEKVHTEIDLEVRAVPETEEDTITEEKQLETSLSSGEGPEEKVEQPQQPQDELVRNAAEAIVALSLVPCDQVDGVMCSLLESPMQDPLSWFADLISSSKDNLESTCDDSRGKDGEDNEGCSTIVLEELDYFESMTLKLTETKEEDYMPKPIVPEDFKIEETTQLLPTRARKGPARRGRQRRDFQRDILPGLASLSRHEVTEDLQIFGGLMRATGHSWHSGLTRRNSSRNGCGRGRRKAQVNPSPPPPPVANETCTPLIQQLNNIEVGLEDRSLTGWGKTTRRPRRQRCPAGNPPSIPLT
ncbi:uncharacterized protein LOC107489274 isoform X1 [Arachis duranensis]|uniref:Uncharacterized protein LOC107489274 isoform X1 n=2 Tax=Arachis duranensis TaxID=130453 RepID=A0A6P4DBC5_ARADU|nr:uncharacterized protein LOC107489274 isoform X1 [Arachis duranensis]XP_025700148.1 uncharacterized protein LOC112801558 isoform X1 [Arachis hypogaea]